MLNINKACTSYSSPCQFTNYGPWQQRARLCWVPGFEGEEETPYK